MKARDCDVVIIGAGVAGLAAAGALSRAGKTVRCLEATDRIGGRILTVHDPLSPVAIELGAEFVHGRPPEIFDIIRNGPLTAHELDRNGGEEFLPKSLGRKDASFEDYIRWSHHPQAAKNWARRYVEGFNAARSELISLRSLKQDADAAANIEGDRSFRLPGGYDQVPLALLRSISQQSAVVQLNSIVERVQWRRGAAQVHYRSAVDGRSERLRCRQVVITASLGVLQAGAIQFDPEPTAVLDAARRLKLGHVYRITFRFETAFWESDAGFLFSKEKRFPTWWTTRPVVSPVLTAWMAGSAAEGFQNSDPVPEALRSLARILKGKVPRPEAAYFHNWQADPFFRGAYSYVPVDGLPARETLAQPVDGTLFFAGEATNHQGYGATVHGAIGSGFQVADQLL
jgi:monoamine oxidase